MKECKHKNTHLERRGYLPEKGDPNNAWEYDIEICNNCGKEIKKIGQNRTWLKYFKLF